MRTLLCFCMLFPLSLLGQQEMLGKVLDSYNKAIDYVNIMNLKTGLHTHTDIKGQFALPNNSIGDTLEVTHVAHQAQIIVLKKEHFEGEQLIVLRDKNFDLTEVVVKNEVRNLNMLATVSLETNPVNSAQELLRKVPGLIIGQHAGGGKAEQIFLRGFDLDHGTDIRIGVDGIPVNMVSHAHGQGYADLHFLIPETVDKIDFGKGPYYTQQGNFATAGYVDFQTKESLDYNAVGIEYGSFNSLRLKGLFNLLEKVPQQHAYIAANYQLSDGPFESSQNFNRINIFGKYTNYLGQGEKLSIQAGGFYSRWDASGQIPQRAVEQGLISRFGAIDDTEGGQTSRINIALTHQKTLGNNMSIKSNFFYSNYQFELYSNFTFFLNDSLNGDQIKQQETRHLFGGQTELTKIWNWNALELVLKGGLGLRYDDSNNNELSHTKNRSERLWYLQYGNIDETNVSAWTDAHIHIKDWTINVGARLDYFKFNYRNLLDSAYQLKFANKLVASPKLSVLYTPNTHWQLYLKTGIGFHSNDTRMVVNHATANSLPLAYGADLGTLWKPSPRWIIDAAIWGLYSEQEMVYVGDEAIVEPSGASMRVGADLGLHWQCLDWLFVDASLVYTYARSIEDPVGQNFIPLAVALTSSGGLSVKHPIGFSGGIRFRYVHDRPANEDYSIVAEGYGIVDLNVNYQYKNWRIGVSIENLFNSAWNETQFATESRLLGETVGIEEIHFTPGTPFAIRVGLEYRF